jgi:hypothetical protein
MILNQQICSKADLVMAAVDYWKFSDGFFGRDDEGNLKLNIVRQRIQQTSDLVAKIRQNKAVGRGTVTLEDNLRKLRNKNNEDLDQLYSQIAHVFKVNPIETAGFAHLLIDRMSDKALAVEPFGPSYEVVASESGIAEKGVTLQTKYGTVSIEPSPPTSVSGGRIVDHGRIRYTTPADYEMNNQRMRFVLNQRIRGHEGDVEAIESSLSFHLTRGFWEALPDTFPSTGLPPVLNGLYDAAGNKIDYDSPNIDNIRGQVVLQSFNSRRISESIAWLSGFSNVLGNTAAFYPISVGELFINLPLEQREKIFSNFQNTNVSVGAGPSLENYNIARNVSNGEILVNGGPINNQSLKDFLKNYEQRFRLRQNIAADVELTPAQNNWLQAELRIIRNQIGQEALRSMQRF